MTTFDAQTFGAGVPESVLDTEVAIIGAGAAGITLARKLAAFGRQVVLLDRGPLGTPGTAGEAATDALKAGDSVGHDGGGSMTSARVFKTGGSTNHYAGFSQRFKPKDLVGWPITIDELNAWYPEAHDNFRLGPFFDDDATELAHWSTTTGQPLPPQIAELVWGPMQKRATRFGIEYQAEIDADPLISLVHHANVTHLEANAAGDAVTSATVRTLNGVEFSVSAAHFVAAAGGWEIPRLLLASNDVVPAGLGNGHGQLGVFADNLGETAVVLFSNVPPSEFGLIDARSVQDVATTTPSGTPTSVDILAGLDLSDAARDALGTPGLHMMFQFFDRSPIQRTGVTPSMITELMGMSPGGAPQGIGIGRAFQQSVLNEASRISLSPELDALGMPKLVLNWQIDPVDAQNRDANIRFFQQRIAASGTGRLQSAIGWLGPSGLPPGQPDAFEIIPIGDVPIGNQQTTFHHLCTARMSDVPEAGVVDKDCRVWGMSNLHVAGSAVHATPSGIVPTLTIVALALRQATYLDGLLP